MRVSVVGMLGALTEESGDHERERTDIACEVYVDMRVLDSRSKI